MSFLSNIARIIILEIKSLSIVKKYEDTNFITGMRMYAAFAVVLIHTGGGGVRGWGETGNRIVDMGAQGVAVFFCNFWI